MVGKICKIFLSLGVLMLPIFANAQLTNTTTVLAKAKYIVTDILIPLAFTLALLFFFYGIVKYVKSEGEGKGEGKQIMIWGAVALFVMSSIWGIVRLLRDEIMPGYDDSTMPIPTIGGGRTI